MEEGVCELRRGEFSLLGDVVVWVYVNISTDTVFLEPQLCLVKFDERTIQRRYMKPDLGNRFEEVTLYNFDDLEETMSAARP